MAIPNYWFYTRGYIAGRLGNSEDKSAVIGHETSTEQQAAIALGVHDGKRGVEPMPRSQLDAEAKRLAS